VFHEISRREYRYIGSGADNIRGIVEKSGKIATSGDDVSSGWAVR